MVGLNSDSREWIDAPRSGTESPQTRLTRIPIDKHQIARLAAIAAVTAAFLFALCHWSGPGLLPWVVAQFAV
jgi:hypothetical protein